MADDMVRDTATARKYFDAGRKAEQNGDRRAAIEAYEAAYAADPDDDNTCFRLAYNLDLVGEEDEALHLYEQCVHVKQPRLNSLLNLAVMYEDRGNYKDAERCLRQVLSTDPNNPRARLYLKDVLASDDMEIDEEQDAGVVRDRALLDTPVTDFDLSVRTRNAIRKMSIRTLADLLAVTEAELRNFKNLGESSIDEIKTMLAQRGLRLGQMADQKGHGTQRQTYAPTGEGNDDSGLNRPVSDLNLSVRARKALALLNVQVIGDLTMRTEAELMGVKNFGMTSLLEIKNKLADMGMSLRQLEA
jgi:DNA-directed RNA polymerase subunit alpha